MEARTSVFDRLVARPRPFWATLAIATLLFAAPFLAAQADGVLGELLRQGTWQGLLVPPTVITYIFLVGPRLSAMEKTVLRSFRRVVELGDEQLNNVVRSAAGGGNRQEAVIFAAGALLGVAMLLRSSQIPLSWLGAEVALSFALMYGLLALVIYGSVLSSRQTAMLMRQPLRVDPFDTGPFEPMGRQSLLLALVFVGGIILSLPFVALQPGAFQQPLAWLIYVPLVAIPVVIFFLGMTPVHRVLAAARDREREAVQNQFLRLSRELMQRLQGQQQTGELAADINALAAYDERLQTVPTWPYNTGMLRTLIFSVFIPTATILGKIAVDVLF